MDSQTLTLEEAAIIIRKDVIKAMRLPDDWYPIIFPNCPSLKEDKDACNS